jgi:CheY-like chemotaxis protein
MFESSGALVTHVPWGDDAAGALAEEAADLLVVDLSAPGAGGRALLRHLRSGPRPTSAPALAVTGHLPEDREAALADGFDDSLAKPLERELLLGRAARLLARRLSPRGESPAPLG